MANPRAGEVALKVGSSPKCKWIFSKEEMLNLASLKAGLDEFKELQFRQQSTKFIQLLGDRLNQPLRDHRGKITGDSSQSAPLRYPGPKITQLCMCAAMIHMHRFFYFHSFTFFDYRDVAAACLFLSGKSEECPRKIDHILRAWWSEKFPGIKIDQQKYDDAMGLLVAIESIILQTIAFDLQVALPHPLVLKAMHSIAKSEYNRKITEVVYFFSTDVLCVTSWGIRYSAEAIAVACVHIVCTWADFEGRPLQMPVPVDGTRWYHATDPTMTDEQLQEMMREFITVYKTCKNDLAITKFIKKGEIRDPISDADSDRATPPALLSDGPLLPPPPPPPLSLASKKVDINAYKERRAADGGGSSSSSSSAYHQQPAPAASGGSSHHHQQQQQQQRRNFMPEMNQTKGVTASMPGFVLPKQEFIKQEPVDRKPEFDSSYRSSSSSQQRPSRPPSNGSSSSSSAHHQQQQSSSQSQSHRLPSYMQQQQPSGSGEQRGTPMMGGERGRDPERERSEKRKREMSATNLNSDKRSRTEMGSGGGQSQRGHSSQSSSQQQQFHQQQLLLQQQHSGSYNSVPPPQQPPMLMQQPPPIMQQGYGSASKQQQHYSMSNGHQQQHRSSYGGQPQPSFQQQQQQYPGYGSHHHHMQNGYGGGVPPPPPPPVLASTGNDMEDGEVF